MAGNTLFVIFLIFLHIATVRLHNDSEMKECLPGQDYRQDCNRCWCVKEGGILVCDKMECKEIPRKMWAKVKLKAMTEKERSIAIAVAIQAGIVLGKKAVIKILPWVIAGSVAIAKGVYRYVQELVVHVVVHHVIVKPIQKLWHKIKSWFGGWFG